MPVSDINKNYGALPKKFHKVKCKKVSTDDCEKRRFVHCIRCPLLDAFVHHGECESCEHGKAGNYREEWVICDIITVGEET